MISAAAVTVPTISASPYAPRRFGMNGAVIVTVMANATHTRQTIGRASAHDIVVHSGRDRVRGVGPERVGAP